MLNSCKSIIPVRSIIIITTSDIYIIYSNRKVESSCIIIIIIITSIIYNNFVNSSFEFVSNDCSYTIFYSNTVSFIINSDCNITSSKWNSYSNSNIIIYFFNFSNVNINSCVCFNYTKNTSVGSCIVSICIGCVN